MARLKGRSSKRLILDIGSSAMRLCELAQTKSGYQLTKYYQREMVIDPALDEPAKREIRRQTLRELLKEAKVRSKRSVFGVPGQSVFTRTRALPPVPEHKVTQIVRYEIQQQIPFALDQIALDYQVLGRTEAGGYDVLMAAIKVDVVDKHLELLQETKRTADIVDVAPLAAYNWLKHTGEFGDQGECVALLDIGASTTDIVIERENQFRFTRSLNIGGNDITAAIGRNFNVGFTEAERLKRERGFAPTGDTQRDGKGGEVIGQILNRLVGEVARSFAYFRSQPGGGPVSRVILTGGTASLRNIVPYLQRQLGVDVRIAQPLAGLAVSANAQEANERPEQASVVLGLALRSIRDVPVEINLIPPRILESAKRKEQAFYWALSVVTLALIMASIIPLRAKRNEVVVQQIDMVKSRLQRFHPSIPNNPDIESPIEKKAQELEQSVASLQDRIDKLDTARTGRQFWLDKLKAINDSRPSGQGVWFSSITTTVIGGPGNTGAVSGAAETPAATTATNPFARPGAPAGATPPAADDDDRPGRLGGLAGLAASLGTAAPGGAGRPGAAGAASNATSAGFPGLQPIVSGGKTSAPTRSRASRRMDDDDDDGGSLFGGGMGAALGGGAGGYDLVNQKSESPVQPNGFTVFGYAQSPEAVTAFIDNLKESKAFIEGGIYLDEAATKNVPIEELYNANAGDSSVSSRIGAAPSGGDRFDRRDRGGLSLNRGMSSYGSSYAPSGTAGSGQTATAFRLDLQFAGKPIELQPGQALAYGGASRQGMPGGRSGLGLGGRERRER